MTLTRSNTLMRGAGNSSSRGAAVGDVVGVGRLSTADVGAVTVKEITIERVTADSKENMRVGDTSRKIGQSQAGWEGSISVTGTFIHIYGKHSQPRFATPARGGEAPDGAAAAPAAPAGQMFALLSVDLGADS